MTEQEEGFVWMSYLFIIWIFSCGFAGLGAVLEVTIIQLSEVKNQPLHVLTREG